MELVLAERGLNSLSSDQVEGNAEKIILLNLSENNMNNSNLLDTFTSLETLILDKNGLTGLEWCCPIPSLKTLPN